MDIFLKATAGVLITALLSLVMGRNSTGISLLLTIFVCSLVVIAALSYFRPVVDLLHRLVQIGELGNDLLSILLKIVGISLISQIACFICMDTSNQTLGKALQIITTAAILCVCVPLLEQILQLIENVLGEI